jgi:hypothetical protein
MADDLASWNAYLGTPDCTCPSAAPLRVVPFCDAGSWPGTAPPL